MMFQKLRNRFRTRYLLHIIYRSGAEAWVWVFSYNIKHKPGELISAEWVSAHPQKIIHMGLSDVTAIYQEDVRPWWR